MPYINIRISKEDGLPNDEQKEKLMAGMAEVFEKVMGRSAKNAVIIIDEIDPTNYSIGGKSLKKIRQNKAINV